MANIQKLIEILSHAKYVVVLTGAGVSAESGIKTFRDPDGLWAKYKPSELASAEAFMANSDLVWSWYQERRRIVHKAKPNPGHYAIAEMQNLFPKFTLITQNVDKKHQQAGSKKVIELHGSIIDNHCFDCKKPYRREIDLSKDELPICPDCGGKIRPSVVWFGEMLPAKAITDAGMAAQNCDVFFSVGTSAEVYPAAHLPIQAKNAGAYVVEVNPNVTSISGQMDLSLRNPAGEAMPFIVENLKKYKNKKKR